MAAVEAEGLVKIYRGRGLEVRPLGGSDLEVEEARVVRPRMRFANAPLRRVATS